MLMAVMTLWEFCKRLWCGLSAAARQSHRCDVAFVAALTVTVDVSAPATTVGGGFGDAYLWFVALAGSAYLLARDTNLAYHNRVQEATEPPSKGWQPPVHKR